MRGRFINQGEPAILSIEKTSGIFYSEQVIITYFDDRCFRIENGNTSILVDPNNNRLKGDIVLRTSIDPKFVLSEKSELSFAGDYEIGGIEIRGFQIEKESNAEQLQTIYEISWDGIHIIALGSLRELLSPEIMDQLGQIDVCLLPVGGNYLSPDAAVALIKKLDPRFIIPYGPKGHNELLKKIGQSSEPQEKLVFKKKDLEQIEQKAVILSSYGG